MRLAQSASAVLGFIFGSFIASQVDKSFHGKHRGKLAGTALLRSIVLVSVALLVAFLGWDGHKGMALLFTVSHEYWRRHLT
jgi:hypothetical protein